MKIIYDKIELCSLEETPKNFSVSLKKKIQSDDIIESAKPLVRDGKNARHVISFTLERVHKNPSIAAQKLFELMQNVSDISPANLEILDEGDLPYALFEDAVLTRCTASKDGRITSHNFEFLAGKGI